MSSTKRKTPDAPRAIKAGDPVRREPRAEKTDEAAVPEFAALDAAAEGRVEYRKVRVPAHRYTPLRKAWPQVVTPLVEQLKLQVRFNPRSRCVELRSAPTTPDAGAVQKCADFVAAFALGFEVADALALLRLEDLFVDVETGAVDYGILAVENSLRGSINKAFDLLLQHDLRIYGEIVVADCVEINHWFGGSPPNFRTLYLNQIEVDSADFWTDRLLSSSSRSTAESVASKRSHTRTLKSG